MPRGNTSSDKSVPEVLRVTCESCTGGLRCRNLECPALKTGKPNTTKFGKYHACSLCLETAEHVLCGVKRFGYEFRDFFAWAYPKTTGFHQCNNLVVRVPLSAEVVSVVQSSVDAGLTKSAVLTRVRGTMLTQFSMDPSQTLDGALQVCLRIYTTSSHMNCLFICETVFISKHILTSDLLLIPRLLSQRLTLLTFQTGDGGQQCF